MLRVLCFVSLELGVFASRFRRQDPDLANALNPLNPVDVRMKDDMNNMPLRCESHADCGWAEYCGWSPTEFSQGERPTRCQACVGCVEPEEHNGVSNYFVAYGVPLAPVTGKCPDCDARAKVGKESQRPPTQKIVQKEDVDVQKLKKQKNALERELEKVKGSIYDSSMKHQTREQALEDEIQALKNTMDAQKVAAPLTTTTTSTTTAAKAAGAAGYHTYNTYNIYNTYNTQHTYNSNGHTFNTWSSCENLSQPMPMGVEQAGQPLSALMLRRQPPGLSPLAPVLDPNCTGVLVD